MTSTLQDRRKKVAHPLFIGVVYACMSRETREVRYVGQTTKNLTVRSRQHLKLATAGRKTPFYDWLRKMNGDVLFVSLELVMSSLEDLGEAEQQWIAHLRGQGVRLLNLSDGGLGPVGHVWTAEQREAARLRSRGRKGVQLYGADNPFFGGHHSEHQRQLWSEMRAGSITGERNPNYGKFGEAHPAYGRKLSIETRERLSEQKRGEKNPNYGKSASAETKAKMSAVRRGRAMPSSVRSAHTRHHTNKGVFKDTCRHCIDDLQCGRSGDNP